MVDEGHINLDGVKIEVKGDTATAGPIDVGNPMGSATLHFTFKKEDGVWVITGGEALGF